MENLHSFVMARIGPMNQTDRKGLAQRSGVSFWTINKYAYGQIKEPSVTKLQRLADALTAARQ